MACAQSYGGGVTHSLAVWGIHHEEGVKVFVAHGHADV